VTIINEVSDFEVLDLTISEFEALLHDIATFEAGLNIDDILDIVAKSNRMVVIQLKSRVSKISLVSKVITIGE